MRWQRVRQDWVTFPFTLSWRLLNHSKLFPSYAFSYIGYTMLLKSVIASARIQRTLGFHGGSAVKNPPANAGDMSSVPRSGRSPGEGNGNPLQCSCQRNPMDRGAWSHKRVRHDLVTKQQQTLPFPSFLLNLFLFFRILKAKAYIIDFLLLSHKNLKL